jgi:hypothetical protein
LLKLRPTSVSRGARLVVTVGSASSSTANGSSVWIVGGKKRLPTKPWAAAARASAEHARKAIVGSSTRISGRIRLATARPPRAHFGHIGRVGAWPFCGRARRSAPAPDDRRGTILSRRTT